MKVIRLWFCGGIAFLADLPALDSINAHSFSASVHDNATFIFPNSKYKNNAIFFRPSGSFHTATGGNRAHKSSISLLSSWTETQDHSYRKALVPMWEPFSETLCTSVCVVFSAVTPATVKSLKTNKGRKIDSLALLQTCKHSPQHESTANCVPSTIKYSEADLGFKS